VTADWLTAQRGRLNNARVTRVVGRATALLVAVPFLTFASALAPTHIHGPGHEHEHAVAHSHFGPHHLESHAHDVPGGVEGPEVEHDDEHVLWIDSPILHEAIYAASPIPPAIPVSYETVQVAPRWSVTPFDDAAPVHGPPKPIPLFRGPPLSLV
jgi:hypothetical protein